MLELNRKGRSRRAFAVKELLVVLTLAGSSGVCLTLLEQIDIEQRDFPDPERELLMQCEVPIADEFICLVSVEAFMNPNSSQVAHPLSRLQFARVHAEPDEGFLFEIASCAIFASDWSCRCCTWSFVSDEPLEDQVCRECAPITFETTTSPGDQLYAELKAARHCWQEGNRLPIPLWRCVPAELQQNGLLTASNGVGLNRIGELDDFPLAELARTIQTAAARENWPPDDPRTILPSSWKFDLPPDKQRLLARALILRLASQLPTEPSECETPPDDAHGVAGAK